ncbi:hypothetical protein CBR_g29451 [Chara braunii]|uniref:tRNA threonylcarbamoyladenosine biosynthesis protein TsaE n=1 Tax=Chara braunii TaxID=69332 RepID=A0A388LAE9_CHABU|nr:hypothetical protein CBR_g29451 [Chara braunii]|eukprot:GBG79301.1 hypothetical protein CBR_g29451 [Chara braunii]
MTSSFSRHGLCSASRAMMSRSGAISRIGAKLLTGRRSPSCCSQISADCIRRPDTIIRGIPVPISDVCHPRRQRSSSSSSSSSLFDDGYRSGSRSRSRSSTGRHCPDLVTAAATQHGCSKLERSSSSRLSMHCSAFPSIVDQCGRSGSRSRARISRSGSTVMRTTGGGAASSSSTSCSGNRWFGRLFQIGKALAVNHSTQSGKIASLENNSAAEGDITRTGPVPVPVPVPGSVPGPVLGPGSGSVPGPGSGPGSGLTDGKRLANGVTNDGKILGRFVLRTEDGTVALAKALAAVARVGDIVCLYGPVGAGKTSFSRHFIRAVAGDEELVVPSPTFLLQQIYEDHAGPPVHHFDLYRLSSASNFDRLGLKLSFANAVTLIEWPERMGSRIPEERLDLRIGLLEFSETTCRQQESAVLISQDELADECSALPDGPQQEERESDGSNALVQESRASCREMEAKAFHSDRHSNSNEEEHSTEESDDEYEDRQPRVITFVGHGDRWEGVQLCLARDEP